MDALRLKDVCCGAGLMSYGFQEAGFEVDEGLDNWPTAIATYDKYIGKGRLVDISDYYPTKHDYDVIVVGATPCQDFSRSNRKRNVFGKRAQLVLDFCRIVKAIQPEVFVFENVIHLSKWAEVALFELKDYKVTKSIVDSAYYGVPQHRRRKIFIGCQSRHITMVRPSEYEFITVRDALEPITDNWGFMKHRPETVEKFRKVDSTTWISMEPTSDYQGVIRLSWDTPACSITNVKKSQILHPDIHRSITTAEAAALQGFPPWYIPEGNEVDKAVQVSNATPRMLAYHIASRILSGVEQTTLG